jgi:DNA-binding protein YbaB
MTTPLPDPNSLRTGLLTLLQALSAFENTNETSQYTADSADGRISATVDGLGRIVSVQIAQAALAGSATLLAAAVRDVVNAAVNAANTATAAAMRTFASGLSLPGLPAFGSAPPAYPDFPGMVTELTTQIIASNPCDSTHVFECTKGVVTAAVDARRLVVSLAFVEPLPERAATLEVDVVRALNCAIDDSTEREDDTRDPTITITGSPGLNQLVLYAKGTLKLNNGVKIKTQGCTGFATIANAGTVTGAQTNLGVEVEVGNIISRPPVVIGRDSAVHGFIRSTGTVQPHESADIDGPVLQNATVVLPDLALNVPFPATPVGTIELEPSQQRTAAPGYYRKIHAKEFAKVFLSTGTYYCDEFILEPNSTLTVTATTGPCVIWVKNTFIFRGAFLDSAGGFPRVFAGYVGTSAAIVERAYRGTLSAPNAKINIATITGNYEGAFHARDIEVFPNTVVCHRPFELRYDDLPGRTPPSGPTPPVVDLGFENLAGWSSPQATLVSAQNPVIQGARSLKINTAPGPVEIASAKFSADLAATGVTRLLVELWVPANQPNPTLFGNLSASISIPSASINNVSLGSLGMTSRPLNQFSVFDFPLPASVQTALNGTHTDVSLKLTLGATSGSGPWYFDNVRFSLPAPAPPSPPTSLNPILSFEDQTKWSSSQAALTRVSSPKTHSNNALKVTSPQATTQIVSVPFSSSALSAPTSRVRIDVWASSTQPDPSNHGRLQLRVDVPSAGITDAATTIVDLTPLPKNVFNTIELVLPTNVKNAIDGTFNDVKLKLVLTVAPGAGPYHFDNIRFI